MMTRLMGVLLISAALLGAGNAQAEYPAYGYENVNLISWQVDLRPGETRSFPLPGGWRQVRKLFVTANAYYGDATLQVYANGDEKGRMFIPRTDPYYVVNIDETTSTLTLRNYSGNGVIRISSLQAELSYSHVEPIAPIHPNLEPISFPALNEAANLARQGVRLVDVLRPYADPATEYVTYLLPIKQVAGRALALANARGVGSGQVRQALLALAQQIQFADTYIESSLKKEASFELAVQLLSLRDKIRRWLD